jgi:hypothetical protein
VAKVDRAASRSPYSQDDRQELENREKAVNLLRPFSHRSTSSADAPTTSSSSAAPIDAESESIELQAFIASRNFDSALLWQFNVFGDDECDTNATSTSDTIQYYCLLCLTLTGRRMRRNVTSNATTHLRTHEALIGTIQKSPIGILSVPRATQRFALLARRRTNPMVAHPMLYERIFEKEQEDSVIDLIDEDTVNPGARQVSSFTSATEPGRIDSILRTMAQTSRPGDVSDIAYRDAIVSAAEFVECLATGRPFQQLEAPATMARREMHAQAISAANSSNNRSLDTTIISLRAM